MNQDLPRPEAVDHAVGRRGPGGRWDLREELARQPAAERLFSVALRGVGEVYVTCRWDWLGPILQVPARHGRAPEP